MQKISLTMKNDHDLERLAEFFELPSTPERIEVYDNSHISGTNAVGAMIVMTRHGFQKNAYRKFNIKHSKKSDDYGMMQEVLERRINSGKSLPDFILIDGGIGHLSAVAEILNKAHIPFASISKGQQRKLGEEIIHSLNKPYSKLPPESPLMHFLQNLRDEAHRFAISSHRKKRLSDAQSSLLDSIPGIGEKKKKALYTHFQSIQKIKKASPVQLMGVPGIDKALANIIIAYLNN